jgi:hypothetical protein
VQGTQGSNAQGFFSRWYSLLQRNKTGGAALPLVGMSIGYFLIQSYRITPEIVSDDVVWLGFYLLVFSAFLFAMASAVYVVLFLREAAKGKK